MATISKTNELNFDILPWETVFNYLKENVQIKRTDHWQDLLNQRVTNAQRELARPTLLVNDYMKWIRARHKNVKRGSKSIPSCVLGPNIIEGELIDARISCRGSDDKLYDRDEQLRQRLPRGCSLIRCRVRGESKLRLDFALFALRKFSGGLGDDDDREDDNLAWLRYFLEHPRAASQIICTKKMNGEACHLSCLALPPDNRLILIAGSKNVHLCFRTHSDIDKYRNETSYSYAGPFCHTILHTLENMPDKGSMLLNFLSLTRYTAVFEILNYEHQHVVNLSYLKDKPLRSELKFLTFAQAPSDFDKKVTNLCALTPDFAIEIARSLHLSTTDYEVINNEPHTLNEYLTSIKYRHECEGSVLYFINKNDEVIGLLKKKTIWYVILRAIREKARVMISIWEKNGKLDLTETTAKTFRRLKTIQELLGFSKSILNQWKLLCEQYLKWIVDKAENHVFTLNDILDSYPMLWSKFLEETTNEDDFMRIMIEKNAEEDIWGQLNQMQITEENISNEQFEATEQSSDLDSQDVEEDDEVIT